MHGSVLHFLVIVKDLSVFDLRNDFYAKITHVGDLQTSGIEDLVQNVGISIVVIVFISAGTTVDGIKFASNF